MCFIVHVHGVFWSFHCPRWRLCALKGVSKFVQQTGVKWREILMKFASNKSALVLLRHQCRRSLHQRSCWCWTTRPQQALTAATDLADLSPLHLWNGKSLVKVKLQMISDVSCLEFLYSICRAHFRLFKCWFPLTPAQPKEWNAQFAMSASWEGRGPCWKKNTSPCRLLEPKGFHRGPRKSPEFFMFSHVLPELESLWFVLEFVEAAVCHDVGLYSPTANQAKLELAVRRAVLASGTVSFQKESCKFNLRVFWSKVPSTSFD